MRGSTCASLSTAGARTAKQAFSMLVQLPVQNVVLLEQLILELSPGFSVLAGETGAAKSMIVDAFALVVGGRARPDIVRGGQREAEVEALFEIEPASRIAAKLDA